MRSSETPLATNVVVPVQADVIGTIICMTAGGAVMLGTILKRRDRAGWSTAPALRVATPPTAAATRRSS